MILEEMGILKVLSTLLYKQYFKEKQGQVSFDCRFGEEKIRCVMTQSLKSNMICTIQFCTKHIRCPAMSLYRNVNPGFNNIILLTKFLVSISLLDKFCELISNSFEESLILENELLELSGISKSLKLLESV